MAIKSVSIRMEEEMLKKLNYVADYEGRSLNSHILVLIRNNIKAFEAENGNIEGSISPDFNVKPADINKRVNTNVLTLLLFTNFYHFPIMERC